MSEPGVHVEEFRGGEPDRVLSGPMTAYIYEVLLDDGTITEGIMTLDGVGADTRWVWRRTDPARTRLMNVVGWRSTVTCDDCREVIAQYVHKPYGVVSRGEFGKALDLHIRMEKDSPGVTCQPCAERFIRKWTERYGECPEGWESVARCDESGATA